MPYCSIYRGSRLKNINLISLIQAFDTLEKENYQKFLSHYGMTIKDKELDDLNSLITIMIISAAGSIAVSIFNLSTDIFDQLDPFCYQAFNFRSIDLVTVSHVVFYFSIPMNQIVAYVS